MISTSKSDVIWNYIGTITSMVSGFALLPLLMAFLSSEELGLWYVLIAISNLAMLFDFGFNPTFARNIVYVISGREILKTKQDMHTKEQGLTDWHLLNAVIRSSKLVYTLIAFVSLLILCSVGTVYIGGITQEMSPKVVWTSWGIFCLAIFINLYFLYSTTILRGYGDVAGENKAKTYSRLAQIVGTAVLLYFGAGLIGAAAGYLIMGVVLRIYAGIRIRLHHSEIEEGRAEDARPIRLQEIRAVLEAVGGIAAKDGIVQLACYASTQAMSLVASLTLGLAETGSYSILLQLGTALYNFAAAYPKSFYPAFQAAFAERNLDKQLSIVSKGIAVYWVMIALGLIGICGVVLPILPYIKEGFVSDYALFLGLAIYLALWQQHSIACNYIIGTNEIPYVKGYIVSALIGVALSYVLSSYCMMGAWGLVIGQAVAQAAYNNWKWPQYLAHKLDSTYFELIQFGIDKITLSKKRHSQ